ncbi:MAG TPA: GntR family transcriptional regulator [Paenirhodobacter sp.]
MIAVSRTAQVYETLRQELLNGRHAPGGKLAIDQIAARFGASTGAVREALSRLTSEHLVVALPQRGFIVTAVSEEDLRDLTEVRIETETHCLRRSIELGGLEWEAKLIATSHMLARVAASAEGRAHPDWTRLHAEFHDDLISACGSVWRLRLRGVLFMQAERYRRMILPRAQATRDIDAEHRAILDHALARNADAAVAALTEHMRHTARDLLEAGLPSVSAAA